MASLRGVEDLTGDGATVLVDAAAAAEVVLEVKDYAACRGDDVQYFESFGHDFGADAVAGEDEDVEG